MKENKHPRTRFVGVRFTDAEFAKLNDRIRLTTTPQISDYIRRMVLNKQLTVAVRNRSLDDFMAEMILLRTELNHIGNNFNQAVRKLNTMAAQTEMQTWIISHQEQQVLLQEKIGAIKLKINQIADEWLQ